MKYQQKVFRFGIHPLPLENDQCSSFGPGTAFEDNSSVPKSANLSYIGGTESRTWDMEFDQPDDKANRRKKLFSRKRWWVTGLIWGIIMLIFDQLIFSFIEDSPILLEEILIIAPIWLLGGLLFGYVMKITSSY